MGCALWAVIVIKLLLFWILDLPSLQYSICKLLATALDAWRQSKVFKDNRSSS